MDEEEGYGWRVRPHIRGHIASCNGSVEKLETKVVCARSDPALDAAEKAALVEEFTEKERQKKALRLAKFQRRVKVRVKAREKEIQKEIAKNSRKAMKSEQKAAERVRKLDAQDEQYVAVGVDVEDVKVVSGWQDSQDHDPFDTAPLQSARKTLLFESQVQHREMAVAALFANISQRRNSNDYQDVQQLSSRACKIRQSSSVDVSDSQAHDKGNIESSTSKTFLNLTAPGHIEHLNRVHEGKRFLMFRRLYSEAEREQVRKKKKQQIHSRQVEAMKQKKEADRKKTEQEVNPASSQSDISTSASEDRLLVEEWEGLIQEEEKKRQEKKAKELERYTTALTIRLRNLIEQKKLNIPPLCSCAKTLWETNPLTCANNCVFYRNSKAYAKALSNILQSSLSN